eukprot:c55203_g1_i1 orf=1-207(+)
MVLLKQEKHRSRPVLPSAFWEQLVGQIHKQLRLVVFDLHSNPRSYVRERRGDDRHERCTSFLVNPQHC